MASRGKHYLWTIFSSKSHFRKQVLCIHCGVAEGKCNVGASFLKVRFICFCLEINSELNLRHFSNTSSHFLRVLPSFTTTLRSLPRQTVVKVSCTSWWESVLPLLTGDAGSKRTRGILSFCSSFLLLSPCQSSPHVVVCLANPPLLRLTFFLFHTYFTPPHPSPT